MERPPRPPHTRFLSHHPSTPRFSGTTHCLSFSGPSWSPRFEKANSYQYQLAKDEIHVHDFHATILHLLGFDHEQLTYRHNGRDYRLTDVAGHVVKGILA